jgi:Ca2+-binding RTX toxin-like protein
VFGAGGPATAGDDRISLRTGESGVVLLNVNGADYSVTSKEIRIDARRGNDLIDLSGLTDVEGLSITVYGGAGDDTIVGSLAGEKIFAGDGNDIVAAGNGRDTVYGEVGDDSIRGNAHNDLLDGGDGADTLRGDDGNDNLSGGANSDRLRGSVGNDTLHGNGGRDYLAGEVGDDALYGDYGNDVCAGGEGVDYLAGGDEIDLLTGGPGDDNFNDRAAGEESDFEDGHDHDLVHYVGGLIDDGGYTGGTTTSGGFIDSNVQTPGSGNVFWVRDPVAALS